MLIISRYIISIHELYTYIHVILVILVILVVRVTMSTSCILLLKVSWVGVN